MSVLKKILGQTAVYGLSSIIGRFLNYLLVPLHTKVFLPEDYGVITELYAEVAFLNILYSFGLETTFFRFATKSPEKQNSVFNISQSIIFTIAIVVSGVIFLFASQIATILEYPDYVFIIKWLGLIMAIDAIVAIPFAKLRLEGKAVKFASFKIVNIVINLLLNVAFLLVLPQLEIGSSFLPEYESKFGVGYVFLANLLANSLYILFFIRTFGSYRPVFSFNKWKPVLTYAWPLVILGFAGVTNEMFSRVMLKYLLPEGYYPGLTNQAALGIFGACYKLSIFMALAVQAFKYAYEPFFFKESDKEDAKDSYASIMTAFVFFGTAAWVGIMTILPELAPIFIKNELYLQGLEVVPVLLGAGLLLGIFFNLSVWYKLTDKTRSGALISIIGMVITIVFNFILIPKMGYMGSAWTAFFTYLIMISISYFWGQKVYRIHYDVIQIVILVSSGIFASSLLSDLGDNFLLRYLMGAGLVITYFLVFAWLSFKRNRKSLK